ncbi:MAG: YciI family protein [Sarcina sp.]
MKVVIIDITYKVDLADIEANLEEHRNFLDKNYSIKKFVCSGRKNPRIGGIIISNAKLNEVKEIIKEDPFFYKELANYNFTEFEASKYDSNFRF